MSNKHTSVLLAESLAALALKRDGIYIDATFGRGGHAREILAQLGEQGRLFALDKDPQAVQYAQQTLAQDTRFHIQQQSFATLDKLAAEHDLLGKVNGILLDLGVSSPQLDEAQRGFSFMQDGPLDMRMDPTQGVSVKQWLVEVDERQLADVFHYYGEERFARRIAKAVIAERNKTAIERTGQLAEIIKAAHPRWEAHKHPATRCFQALRIVVNDELGELERCLPQTVDLLAPGGRLAVISFHSLEERLVKRFIREQVRGDNYPAHLPVTQSALQPTLRSVGKPQRPSDAEVEHNPRARSAVLRVAERVA